MKLLADTSALLALFLRNDQHHADAADFVRQHPSVRFVVTDLVLSEVATRLRARAGAALAVRIVRALLSSRRYELLLGDAVLIDAALDHMSRLADKRLSLCDCASFAMIERLQLGGAFTFDRDFRDCGYHAVP